MAERQINGKIVVITGASSGFGRGTAIKFAQSGASVVLAARRDRLLDEVASECEQAGGRALTVPTDVSHERDVSRLAELTVGEFGRIDVWVNNAGAGAVGRFDVIPMADHVKVIQTDLLGTLYGSYYAMRQFRQQGSGILICVSSVIGKIPSPYFSSYAAAKHGVVGMCTSIRQELEQEKIDSIRVCTIPPTYDPQEVVDTIVGLASDPKDEVTVGTAAKLFNAAHHIFPGLVEAMIARETRKAQFDNAQPDRETSGSLHEPMPSGTEVTGGWKK
jgi:NAD(P)-dependent dehydrogenase (short-subunit alcohol dehydrogenase family)